MWSTNLHVLCAVASACGGANFAVMARAFQDDLLAVNSARLRAEGVIKPGAASAVVSFGEGEDALVREVKVWHRQFPNGRGISLFLCPACGGKAQLLKLYDGRLRCRNCLRSSGVQFRIASGRRWSGRRRGRRGLRSSRRSWLAAPFGLVPASGGGSSGGGRWSGRCGGRRSWLGRV
jgi:hypothetical protein